MRKTFPSITVNPTLEIEKIKIKLKFLNSNTFNFEIYLKYWMNEILWPSFSLTPAQTMFDDAPYKLPFPPKVGPNANAYAIG